MLLFVEKFFGRRAVFIHRLFHRFFHSLRKVFHQFSTAFLTVSVILRAQAKSPFMRKLSITDLNRISVEEFKAAPKLSLTLVLDNVRSVYNVGSVFRTADAFRVEKILLCGITAVPPSTEIHKTALGAEFSVDWAYYQDALQAVNHLKDNGYKVWAIEQVQGSTALQDWQPKGQQKYALVLGNEVKGVTQEVVDACHGALEIPQYGTKHSLNVSCAASVVMWEFFRQVFPF